MESQTVESESRAKEIKHMKSKARCRKMAKMAKMD